MIGQTRQRRSLSGGALAVAVAFAVSGCDGDNLFEVQDPLVGDDDPPEVDLQLPSEVAAGEVLTFQVSATGPEPIEAVEADLVVGDHVDSTTRQPPAADTDVTVELEFGIPLDVAGEVAVVTVRAHDATSSRSPPVEGQVSVVEGS